MILKKTKISKKYQTVIPSIVRTRLGLNAFDHINFVEKEDGRIYLEKSNDNSEGFNDNGLDFIALAKILLSTNSPLILDGECDETTQSFKDLLLKSLTVEQAAKIDLIICTKEDFEPVEIKMLKDSTRYTIVMTDNVNHCIKIANYTLIRFNEGHIQTIQKFEQSKSHIIYDCAI